MVRETAYLATALLSFPAAAQTMDVLQACATAPIGSETCDAEDLAENLGLLTAGQMRIFGDAGMESFAMLTALRYAASAIFSQAESEGCYAEEERTAAIDIWSLWVSLPPDAPVAIQKQFAIYSGVMDGVINMEVGC